VPTSFFKLHQRGLRLRSAHPTKRLPTKAGKRSAERRIVQPMSAQSARRRAAPSSFPPPLWGRVREGGRCAHAFRRSRSRHSPPVPPDGSAPEPGFPRRLLTGVLPASRKNAAAVKHAPCGPVFVPVDRGPRAARERIGKQKNPRAGTAPRLRCYGMPSGTAPCTKRGNIPCNRKRDVLSRKK
jgi:hypothetical protein